MNDLPFVKKLSAKAVRAGYYPLLFLLSILWVFYYRPDSDAISMASFIAQQLIVFSLLQSADILSSGRKLKYTLAGTAAIYIFLIHLNAFLLSVTSMTLYESVTILAIGGDFLYTLEEAGLSTGFIALLVLLLVIISSAGALVYRYLPHAVFRGKIPAALLPVLFSISAMFFIIEQSVNRESVNFFSRREYPLYFEIYTTNSSTQTFSITGKGFPAPDDFRNVTGPANRKNVLFILLESFRADSVNRELSPFMEKLAINSPEFSNYYTDAIYTSLAWNTILMDRPPYSLSSDIGYDMEKQNGSPVFRIFKKAGYETYAAFSANLEWKNFEKRVNGRDRLIDNYYCGYLTRDEERNHIDNRTVLKTAEWLDSAGKEKPFFMMIQLDSTHWTYYADEENRISKPYAGKDINVARLRNPGDIEHLKNRYRNSVRQVNMGIEKIITALKENGKYDNTVIVIVSDHGEGFSPGMIGHSVMHDEIKKPAFIMQLPGLKRYTAGKFMSHMDIFPTLFDYLGINGTGNLMRGRSVFDSDNNRKSVLSFHGSIMLADLSFSGYTVLFRVKNSKDTISFTPVRITDRKGRIINNHNNSEWINELRQIFTGNK